MEQNTQGLLFGGDWTEQKLSILAQYLTTYRTALKKQPFRMVYLDAFAGTGYRQAQRLGKAYRSIFNDIQEAEPQRFLKGSAKLALEVRPPFHEYVFVESDADNVKALERLKDEHADKASMITIVQDDANDFVRNYCAQKDWRLARAVLFLDPFATQVQWSTVEAVAATGAVDVWILFPMMAVNRLLANDPQKACRPRLDAIFGTSDWFNRFYRLNRQESIFGQPLEEVVKACDFDAISEFYLERLRVIFAGVSDHPKVLCNSRGSPLFQLFFAAANVKGAEIAVRIADHLLRRM